MSRPHDDDRLPLLPTLDLATRHRTRPASGAATDAVDVMRAVSSAWQDGDYPRLLDLLHPDGSWTFTCETDEVYESPTALVEAIRQAQSTTIYRMEEVTHTALSEQVVLGGAFVRRPLPHGHAVDRHFWLCEVRDGRFYRSSAFRREQDARSAFAAGWAEPHTAPSIR
jgi:ketosteroid isomerase-like protein